MTEGVDLCLKNALQFCSDARVLIEKASYEHALGFCIFAIEEVGKAVLLKSKAYYAQKESKVDVFFGKENSESLFHRTTEYLNARGFQKKEVYPFYDHLSKLLFGGDILSIAEHINVMKIIDRKEFSTLEELRRTIDDMLKQAQELAVEKTDLRELALYVDYDEEKGEWTNGKLKLTPTKIERLVTNIETAIELARTLEISAP